MPTMPSKLNVPSGAMGPSDKDVLAQLNTSHPIQISEQKVCLETHSNNIQWIDFSLYFSMQTISSTWTVKWFAITTASALKSDTWWSWMRLARSAACRSCRRAISRAMFSWDSMRWSSQPTSTVHRNSQRKCRSPMPSLKSAWEYCKM